MEQKTAQQKAEERWPDDCENLQAHTHRTEFQRGRMHGCAACYREEVEPRDRIIQELVDAIMDNARHRLLAEGEEGDTVNDFLNMTLNTALAKAKEQFGIEPSKP